LSYFPILHSQFGDTQIGFLRQAFHTHTKKTLQDMLKCLSRTGLKMGGKLADVKSVLADRLAFWLNQVVEAEREVHGDGITNWEGDLRPGEVLIGPVMAGSRVVLDGAWRNL
jgi:hypothetical protein